MTARLARPAALALAVAATGLSVGFAALAGSPAATAQGYVPCAEWQAMHPGWPCIDTPQPPLGGPPTISTPPPLPSHAPGLPSQPGGGDGIGAGALIPPPIAPGNGTPIVPVPGAETPALPGSQPLAPAAPQQVTVSPPPVTDAPAPSAAPAPPPAPAATAAQSPAHTDTPAPTHDGGDGRIPLLLLAGVAAFFAPAVRVRGGSSAQQLTITKPWDAGEQTFILMNDPGAPWEYRFPQDVPPGGQLRKNPDGSVDVLDAAGTIVSHTNPPWAYDALGRPVTTWYDIDGDTIVQHIEPDADNVFPILADPDTVPSCSIDGQGGATITHTDGTQTHYPANTAPSTSADTGVSSQQQAADQLARAHGDVPDSYTGHVPIPAQTTEPSSSVPANSTAPQNSTYQASPAEQQAADQLAHAHSDVPDDYTGHVPVAPPPGTAAAHNESELVNSLSNGSTAVGSIGGAAQGAATKTPQGTHWAPGSGPTFTPEEALRAGRLAGRLTQLGNAMEAGSAVIDLADGKPPGETIGKSGGAIGGGWAGAYAGAAIGGAIGGPVGALIGGGIGAFAGSTYGGKAGKWFGSLFD